VEFEVGLSMGLFIGVTIVGVFYWNYFSLFIRPITALTKGLKQDFKKFGRTQIKVYGIL
jgi:hypothetical protein